MLLQKTKRWNEFHLRFLRWISGTSGQKTKKTTATSQGFFEGWSWKSIVPFNETLHYFNYQLLFHLILLLSSSFTTLLLSFLFIIYYGSSPSFTNFVFLTQFLSKLFFIILCFSFWQNFRAAKAENKQEYFFKTSLTLPNANIHSFKWRFDKLKTSILNSKLNSKL